MKHYIEKHCNICGCGTAHIPTTYSFVLDHLLKILTGGRWPTERTPARYTCSICEIDQTSSERAPLPRRLT